LTPNGTLPDGMKTDSAEFEDGFDNAKQLDAVNELRPKAKWYN